MRYCVDLILFDVPMCEALVPARAEFSAAGPSEMAILSFRMKGKPRYGRDNADRRGTAMEAW